MAPRFVARQLSRPSGIMGALIRFLMNRHNARMNAFAVRQLNIEPTDRVLEIGFGGGVTLQSLMKSAAYVAGVDRSDDVIGWAQRRFSTQINADRADFRQGNVEALPFDTAAFDSLFLVFTRGRFCRDPSRAQTAGPGCHRLPSERADGSHGNA